MSVLESVGGRKLDLPPPYRLVTLREAGDAFAHACRIAAQEGAGALVWVRRYDLAEFALVLEPDEPLARARGAIYAGMGALADALARHAPPGRPITFDWPDAIRVDGVLVGGGRLGWPEGTGADEVPGWLVFSAMIRLHAKGADDPGLRPLAGALDELGFDEPGSGPIDVGVIIAGFSRHLMRRFDQWNQSGFPSIATDWLIRLPARHGQGARLSDEGDLLICGQGAQTSERRDLAAALARPSWLDNATGMPWC